MEIENAHDLLDALNEAWQICARDPSAEHETALRAVFLRMGYFADLCLWEIELSK